MADQTPKIKSNRQVLEFKPSRLCLQTLVVGLCVFYARICLVLSATCPPSVPISSATTTEQCSFSEYTSTQTDGIAVGPVSNSIYYLYRIYISPSSAAVRKEDASGSQTWMASTESYPIVKSLSVDAAEQSVYLASLTNTLVVIKLSASDGSIVSQHRL